MILGVTFHAMGAYDAAIREFQSLLEDHPEAAKAYYNLGLSYTLKADYGHARDAFETYLRLAPDAVERSYIEQILDGFDG
jgi:tetratricopeptide (TPR) repeat protein